MTYFIGNAEWVDDVPSLGWTTTPPTQEGVYWLYLDGGAPEIVRVAYETYPNGKRPLVVYTAEAGRMNEEAESVEYYSKFHSHWLGPLPVPELPKV